MTVQTAFNKEDQQGTYAAMNQFMEKLLAKDGGIPGWSARTLFDFSGHVTPAKYHDAQRHSPLLSTEDFDYSRGQPLWLGDGAYILDDVWESARYR